MPPKQTEFEDIVVSRTQMDEELQTFGPLARSDKRFGALNSINFYLFDKKSMTLYSAAEFSRRQIDKKRIEIVESQKKQKGDQLTKSNTSHKSPNIQNEQFLPISAYEKCINDAKKIQKFIGHGDEINGCSLPEVQNRQAKIVYEYEERMKQNAIKEIDNNQTYRPRAKDDIISQALNYVSGSPEDGSGRSFWYPVNRQNGQCQYGYRSMNRWETTYDSNNAVDLNKGNPSAIQFFTEGNLFITKVEGLPDFKCRECNGDRVRRAWALIYRECKGNRKAF